jgi:elongation factor P hydroxylase
MNNAIGKLKQKVNKYVLFEQSGVSEELKVDVLEIIFNRIFSVSENTLLISGGEEPIYLPVSEIENVNKIISTRDYFSSALHEVSHWCLAGVERRKLVDYGYWYEPDGRTLEQQRLFEQAEIKPQALEWLFTLAAGGKFRLSVDNVNQAEMRASNEFGLNVYDQALRYLELGLPERAQQFLDALLSHFQPATSSSKVDNFMLELLN